MSDHLVNSFYEVIKTNSELQAKLASATSREAFNQLAVQLGKDHGFDFTTDEVDTFVSHYTDRTNVELCDEDLAMVAGGKRRCPLGTRFTFCVMVSSCWGSKC
jgi:predicted ribosomally synthesized peptide with nif11-like leader